MVRTFLFFTFFVLAGCTVADDALEPNDDVAHATPLAPGAPRDAVVLVGNDDLYTTAVSRASTLHWRLASTGHEREARIGLVGANGAIPSFPATVESRCDAPDAPLPRLLCWPNGSFDLLARVAEGESGVVVIHQPPLCVECFGNENTQYTLSVDVVPLP